MVVELKAGEFEPGFTTRLGMYQNIVNDTLNHPEDKPSVGLLLVKSENKTVVEYSLAGHTNPMGVANWGNRIVKLPDELESSLPSTEDVEKELEK